MKLKAIVAAAMLFAVGPALACGGPPVCTVKDPTNTDLNVRAAPQGRILKTLKDGEKIEIVDHQEVRGQRWARVAAFNPDDGLVIEGGWVFAQYLRCRGETGGLPEDLMARDNGSEPVVCTVADPTGTPLNVRYPANGTIQGTVANGMTVRAAGRTVVNGKVWLFVEKFGADNAIGWVFDRYLACEEEESH
jgi:hypothetical protein